MKSPLFHHKSVRQLRQKLEERVFAIPKLQREFVWNGKKAAALLDSMYRGMPIGSIMVWETGKQNMDLLRPALHLLPPFNTASKSIWYLIDGQQRLSVLHQSFRGEQKKNSNDQIVDFSRLCFRVGSVDGDESSQWFSYRKPIEGQYVSATDILADNWRSRLRHLSKVRTKKVEICRERLLGYRVPVIVLETTDLAEIREAFIRINSQGMRIGAADRAFARASTIDLRNKANDLKVHLPEDFRDISYETILLGFSFVTPGRGEPDVGERALEAAINWWETQIAVDNNVQKQFLSLWASFRAAFQKAIDHLTTFAVLDKDFLPSVNMLATLTVFFHCHPAPPNTHQRAEIRKWFWATGVGQRYSGRGYRQNIVADVGFFKKLATNRTARFQFLNLVDKTDVLKTEYSQPAALAKAFHCLLAKRKPCYLTNGEPVLLVQQAARANRTDRHHIFPRALLNQYGFRHREYNSLCNICFVVAQENQSIGGARSPRSYLVEFESKKHFARAMRSHLIPHDAESGLRDRGVDKAFRTFRKRRLQVICKAFEQEAGIRLFRKD